ncbi:Beta-lactamase OXA-1, partial [Frankliniella fusca]
MPLSDWSVSTMKCLTLPIPTVLSYLIAGNVFYRGINTSSPLLADAFGRFILDRMGKKILIVRVRSNMNSSLFSSVRSKKKMITI